MVDSTTRAEHPTAKRPATRSSERRGRVKAGPPAFPIVVIGASAGGLDAFKRFLSAMPGECGMALVLIPHLDPRHTSMMAELLAKHTPMPVREVEDGMRIEPNHVYVIPPSKFLAVRLGRFALSRARASESPTAIDSALCSLAADQKEASIGIILSGTGNHGTAGAKAIKLAGGIVIVQDPATAEFDQMPSAALAEGFVDHVLAPEKMPEALLGYLPHWHPPNARERRPSDPALDAVRQVLALLQVRGKHHFRFYRKGMIVRRIERRMALLQVSGWDAYLERLRTDPQELKTLSSDLLIGVTSFFRDPESFDVLAKEVVPKLVDRATADAGIRVWVPGCASGEEAYSIAIAFFEQFAAVDKVPSLQMFATDIDERALEKARRGIYPDSICPALAQDRLRRFFTRVDREHYQVSKQLRDSIVFAQQDLITDAPFSKLDLISCRNVLIYLEPEVQEKIISILHFALNDNGYLMLGPSESVGRASGMFEPLSKKWRVYRRLGPSRRDLVTIPIVDPNHRRSRPEADPRPVGGTGGFTQLMQRLLMEEFAPAAALINRDFEILSVQGPLVNYLEFPPGDMTKDLLAMARQGLRAKVRDACQLALREARTVRETAARVRRDGRYVPCTVTVRPLAEPQQAEGLLLVVFQDRHEPGSAGESSSQAVQAEEPSVIQQLENELRTTREELQSTIEELESSNEELKVSNEEIMSMNEELQSTNEELETSKEELQSLNEELRTVNSQLQENIENLDATNSDLSNLMSATEIPTLFLDRQLKIKRFTPPTTRLLGLGPGDIGKAFHDFASRCNDRDLPRDAERVLRTLAPAEKMLHTDANHWFLRRVLPYHAADGAVDGIVITFFDITERMEAEARARHLAQALQESNDAVIVSDLNGRIIAWNRGAEQLYGYEETEALGLNMTDLLPEDRRASVADLAQRATRGDAIEPFESKRRKRDGTSFDAWVTVTPLKDDEGTPKALVRTERDVTVLRRAEQEMRALNAMLEQRIAERTAALKASEQRIRSVLDAAVDAIITIDSDGEIQTFNAAAERMFGYDAEEITGSNVKILMPSLDRDRHDDYLRRYRETGERRIIGTTRELRARRKDGTEFPIQLSVNEIPALKLFTGVVHDISRQHELQEEIVRIATLEQRRLGQELHDGPQQELTGLGLLAENLTDALRAAGGPKEAELAARISAGIGTVNRHVRSLAQGLVPLPVPEGLMSGLENLAKVTEDAHGVECRFVCPAPIEIHDDAVSSHLFRIAQEAVTNAVKHADATEIEIRLERAAPGLVLSVSDDGRGGSKPRKGEGLGLRIMEYRCEIIGGRLLVQAGRNGGTTVVCRIPRYGD